MKRLKKPRPLGLRTWPGGPGCSSQGWSACLLLFVSVVLSIFALPARASLFADVSGVVHDLQHHPLPSAEVVLQARGSELTLHAQTNAGGDFHFVAVPFGQYTLLSS